MAAGGAGADSVALYMAAGGAQEIARTLIAACKPGTTPAALVESATLPGESRLFTTLGRLAAEATPPAAGPVVMLVGEVFAAPLAMALDRPHPYKDPAAIAS